MILEAEKASLFQPNRSISDSSKLDVIEGNAAYQVTKVTAPEQPKTGTQPKQTIQPVSVSDRPIFSIDPVGTLGSIQAGTEDGVCEFCEQWRPFGIFLAVIVAIFFTLRS